MPSIVSWNSPEKKHDMNRDEFFYLFSCALDDNREVGMPKNINGLSLQDSIDACLNARASIMSFVDELK